MSRLIPLVILLVAACDAPLEHIYPRENMNIYRDGIHYRVRAQFDPIQYEWFTRVWSPNKRLGEEDREIVFDLVEGEVGPKLCEGQRLKIEDGETWHKWTGPKIELAKDIGEWRLIGACT